MARDVQLIRFNALRNALYHTGRRRSLETWNRVFNFLVVLLGATAFSDLFPWLQPAWIGGIVAAIGAAQLVFDFGGSARTHQALQRDYFHVLAEIEESPTCSEDECRGWDSKLVRITADEPPVLRGLDSKAYNDAVDAMEFGRGERLIIPWWHLLLGQFYAFEGHTYRKVSEVAPQNPLPAPAE